MWLCLLTLLAVDGEGAASPSGTVLPNCDALVAVFRQHLARYDQPLDHFRRRRLRNEYNQTSLGLTETTIEGHGVYAKSSTHEKTTGVVRDHVLNPAGAFGVIKLPGQTKWKVMYERRLEKSEPVPGSVYYVSLARDYREIGYNVPTGPLEGPGWTVARVTAERAHGVPVYRFHFTVQGINGIHRVRQAGHFDVDPATWAIVKAVVLDAANPNRGCETELTYQGVIQGQPLVKRIQTSRWETDQEGKTWKYPSLTIELLEFTEMASYSADEYALGNYGLGPPYRAITGVTATGVLAVGWGYALTRWRRQRLRRSLTWEVTAAYQQ